MNNVESNVVEMPKAPPLVSQEQEAADRAQADAEAKAAPISFQMLKQLQANLNGQLQRLTQVYRIPQDQAQAVSLEVNSDTFLVAYKDLSQAEVVNGFNQKLAELQDSFKAYASTLHIEIQSQIFRDVVYTENEMFKTTYERDLTLNGVMLALEARFLAAKNYEKLEQLEKMLVSLIGAQEVAKNPVIPGV